MGWLEPLLSEIKYDRRTVPSPVIDVIHYETFEYMQAMPQVSTWQIVLRGSAFMWKWLLTCVMREHWFDFRQYVSSNTLGL